MMGKDQSLGTSTITSGNETREGGSGSRSSGEGSTQNVIQGSFSVTNPTLTIQVMDANDPNRIVRTISPPGRLDKTIWDTSVTLGTQSITIPDPRPWKEKFFEGQRGCYFVVNAHQLNSYDLQIRVPSSYLG